MKQHEETIAIKNGSGYYIKKIYLILTLILALLAVTVAIATPFVWRETTNIKLEDSAKRIERLEDKIQLIDEIKFNLKQYMQSQGIPYTELNK